LVIAGTAATAVRDDLQRAQSGAFSMKRTVAISGVFLVAGWLFHTSSYDFRFTLAIHSVWRV
jgi:hypothetical protein